MPNAIDELLRTPIPKKLWHYTSIHGFQGIVSDKSIFATDLRFLNDREEFVHVRQIAEEVVNSAPELDAEGYPNREWLETIVKLAFDPGGPVSRSQVFVACFTASEDQLGQWRGYSHGSSGVSMAFNLDAVRPADPDKLVSFAPCVYDVAEKKRLVVEAISPFRNQTLAYWKRIFELACAGDPSKRSLSKETVVREYLASNESPKEEVGYLKNAIALLSGYFMRIAALLKNKSFAEENEWRLVLPILTNSPETLTNPPKFRVGKTTLIPYINHPLASGGSVSLVDVILGPGSDDNSVFATAEFLKMNRLNVTPRLSKVPYRTL